MSLYQHQSAKAPVLAPDAGDRIGLMADSHGDAGMIDAAAGCLRGQGCEKLFHLGDICDSARPQSAAACLKQLALQRIVPVRGNNENTLLLDRPASVPAEILAALEAMPLARRVGSALLVHSLPYTDALGARCMLEALTGDHIRSFFRSYPETVLFRGHCHDPEIVRLQAAALSREKMKPGRIYRIESEKGAIVTCGALSDGVCLIWDRCRRTVAPITPPAGPPASADP